MRNKVRLICAILFMILGIGYPVSATENLKEVRDKYRNSYNKFMNALKQGADQNTIDQLSYQCKTDYDEYQKVASGKSGNTEKPHNTSVSSATSVMAQSGQNNSLKINEKKLEEMKKEAVKKMKECSPDSILMVEQEIRVNGKLYKYKTFAPETSKNKKKTSTLKLKKITAPLRISEPSKDPEIDANKMLSDIAEKLNSFNPTEADSQAEIYLEIDQKLHEICIKYPQYSYICAQAKIYAVDLYMKANFKDNLTKTYQIKNLCGEINEYYFRDKNPLTIKAFEMLSGKIAVLNQKIEQVEKSDTENINKKFEEARNYKKVFEKDINENSGQVYSSEGYWPSFGYDLNNALNSYSEAAYACAFNGHYSQAKEIMDEMESLYNSVASEVTVTYNVRYGSDKTATKTIKIQKNSGSYWAAKGSCTLAMKMRLQRYYYDDERTLSLKSVNEEIKKFNEGINAPPGSDETNNFPMELAIVQGMLKSPIAEPKFIEVYFTKPEEIKLSSDEIVDSSDEVTLKLILDKTTTNNLMPINAEVSSNVSERHKRIKIRPNTFYGLGYYARIKFNEDEGGNDRNKNLIKKHGNDDDELKHTICTADANPMYSNNPFKDIINSNFFSGKVLCKGIIYEPKSNNEVTINTQFLENIGCECIKFSYNDNVKTTIKVANQADWFVAQGHGFADSPQYRRSFLKNEKSAILDVNYWLPSSLKKFRNRNLSFVLLGVCCLIQEPRKIDIVDGTGMNAIEWQNLWGRNVVIMGYSHVVFGPICSQLMKELVNSLESLSLSFPYIENDKTNVINKWLEVNKNNYNSSISEVHKAMLEKDVAFSQSTVLYYQTIKDYHTEKFQYAKWASAIYENMFYKLKPIDNEPNDVNFNKKINPLALEDKLLEINEQEVKY